MRSQRAASYEAIPAPPLIIILVQGPRDPQCYGRSLRGSPDIQGLPGDARGAGGGCQRGEERRDEKMG